MTKTDGSPDISEGDDIPNQIDEIDLIRERLEEAERERTQFHTLAQRAQADLANYKKRATQEMDETRRHTASKLLLQIISIKDDLQRAIDLVPTESVAASWAEGLQLVIRNIDGSLQIEGVTKIDSLGVQFDPLEFEAIQYEETDQAAEGTVIQVFKEGYKLHEKILRAAQVVVAKHSDMDKSSEQTQDKNAEETD